MCGFSFAQAYCVYISVYTVCDVQADTPCLVEHFDHTDGGVGASDTNPSVCFPGNQTPVLSLPNSESTVKEQGPLGNLLPWSFLLTAVWCHE